MICVLCCFINITLEKNNKKNEKTKLVVSSRQICAWLRRMDVRFRELVSLQLVLKELKGIELVLVVMDLMDFKGVG